MSTPKPILCRLRLHYWGEAHTEEGERYLLCSRCGKDDYLGAVSPGEGPHWPGKAW